MLNSKLSAPELVWQLQDSEAKFLFSEACFSEKNHEEYNRKLQEINIYLKEDLTEVKTVSILMNFNLNDMSQQLCTHLVRQGNQKGSCKHSVTIGGVQWAP